MHLCARTAIAAVARVARRAIGQITLVLHRAAALLLLLLLFPVNVVALLFLVRHGWDFVWIHFGLQ
jgi:hypothetical protein